jgi:hypothetical protein
MIYKIEPFIETHSGKEFHFLNPTEDDIDIDDIAFSLSNQSRYTGHTVFYSVAEHSILVAELLYLQTRNKDLALAGLLHDASEAYLSDLASPLKQFFPEYKKMEDLIDGVIKQKFKLISDTRVKQADLQQLCTEAYYLLPSKGKTWKCLEGLNPYDGLIPEGLAPNIAYDKFLFVYKELTKSPIIL